MENREVVNYIRPLDRSQDKTFEKLKSTDQNSVTSLRQALEKAKSRVVTLRDNSGVKDDLIEEERILRKAAEDRLETLLVDLYENPEVNEELRHRLPHARKREPLQINKEKQKESQIIQYVKSSSQEMHNHDLERFADEETIQTAEVTNNFNPDMAGSFEDCDIYPIHGLQEENGPLVWSASSIPTCTTISSSDMPAASRSFSSNTMTQSGSSTDNSSTLPTFHQTSLTVSVTTPGFSSAGPLSTCSVNSIASFSALPSVNCVHSLEQSPRQAANPLASASLNSLAASSYIGLPSIHGYNIGSERTNSVQPTLTQKHKDTAMAAENTTPQVDRQSIPFTTQSFVPNINAGPLFVNPLPPLMSDFGGRGLPSDNVSHISRLLAEIATLKKENAELKEKLKTAEQKCEAFDLGLISSKDKEEEPDIGAMIEEIRAAEKTRDQTMKAMAQVAVEDKEKAAKDLNKSKVSKLKKVELTKIMKDEELSDLEDDGFANTSGSLSSSFSDAGERRMENDEEDLESGNKRSDSLSWNSYSRQQVAEMIQRQRLIRAEELRKVIDERNEARQRIIILERKLYNVEAKPKTNGKLDELIATLGVVRRERDVAVARLKAMMVEVSETKLIYSLHKALFKEAPHNEMGDYDNANSKLSKDDESLTKKNSMSSQVTRLAETKAKLESRLAFSEQEREHQSRRIKELENLVQRQREKLNYLCAGPMLLDGGIETE